MDESGFRYSTHQYLDPGAQEFIPASSLPSHQPHIYYHYPPPVYDMGFAPLQFPTPTAYVIPAADPPPQPPVSLRPSPTAPPSRALLLSMVPPSVSESTVRRDLEVFGDVRAVQMERRRQGLVTVHFYDVTEAEAALVAIQQQHMQQQFRIGQHYDAVLHNSFGFMPPSPPPPPPPPVANGLISGRVVWAQFVSPVTAGLPDGNNQGTLVIFNLDSRVSTSYLQEIFEAFGPVKELRETPKKRCQKFVEFYDVRNAAAAMAEMNGKELFGKPIVVDFSRPGGHQSKKLQKGSQISSNSRNFPTQSRTFPPSTLPLEQQKLSGWAPPPRRGSGGSRSSSSTGSSVHGSMSKLRVNDYEECSNKKAVFKKSGGGGGGGNSKSGGGGRAWKGGGGGGGRNGNDYDPRFLINEGAIMESDSKDCRTTVMIKNIPNKYSQKLLLNMLDNHCIHCNELIADDGDDQPLSSYDFVYLPIDFINKCNVGYGFVNMTSPEATLRLYKAFHHQSWEVFNSRKICQVTYARLQGLDALREHFKNSKFPGDAEEYMPVVFSPPRDGRRLPDPMPIVGCASPTTLSLSPQSSATSSKDTRSESPIEGVICHTYNAAGYETEEGRGGSGSGGYGGNDERETVNE